MKRELVRTYYRSITPDGTLWCESRDLREVIERSEGLNCTFETMRVYETTDGWEPLSV